MFTEEHGTNISNEDRKEFYLTSNRSYLLLLKFIIKDNLNDMKSLVISLLH